MGSATGTVLATLGHSKCVAVKVAAMIVTVGKIVFRIEEQQVCTAISAIIGCMEGVAIRTTATNIGSMPRSKVLRPRWKQHFHQQKRKHTGHRAVTHNHDGVIASARGWCSLGVRLIHQIVCVWRCLQIRATLAGRIRQLRTWTNVFINLYMEVLL